MPLVGKNNKPAIVIITMPVVRGEWAIYFQMLFYHLTGKRRINAPFNSTMKL